MAPRSLNVQVNGLLTVVYHVEHTHMVMQFMITPYELIEDFDIIQLDVAF